MTKPNRDLLILCTGNSFTELEREQEEVRLHHILQQIELFENFALAHEIINVHRNKIFRSFGEIKRFLTAAPVKPFAFLYNCN